MILLSLAVLGGCVPKKKYDELLASSNKTEAELRDASLRMQQQANELQMALTNTQASLAETKSRLSAREAELAQLQTRNQELVNRNATMLKDKGALKAEIEATQAALAELERRKAAADMRLREFRNLLSRFQSLIDAGTLEVKIVDGRMVVAMATDVLFASGSATLSKDGKAALTEVTSILASIPDRQFQVEGHTDHDPIATAQFPSNWFLASRRALNVVQHMLDNGMAPDRISGASFGEHRPVAANDTKENKALNRRIEIVVVPDLEDLPGYDELQAIAQ